MYYVEARFKSSGRADRFDLLASADAVLAWARRNVTRGMMLRVFVPSSATAREVEAIKSAGAVQILSTYDLQD
jgi:hypothetical protein